MTEAAGPAIAKARTWLRAVVRPWTLAVALIGYSVAISVATVPALLARLDQEILPELGRLVGKHQQLGQELRAYRGERGGRLRPSAQTLRELENLYARQQGVIEGVVQQVVDLDASLSGLIQEGDERGIMTSVQVWNTRISERWRALREMGIEG